MLDLKTYTKHTYKLNIYIIIYKKYIYMLYIYIYILVMGFPCGSSGKEPVFQCRKHKRPGFDPWVREMPWRRAWQPTPAFLPRESHGQRRLVG